MRTAPRVLIPIAVAGLAVRLFMAFHWFGSGDLVLFSGVAERVHDNPFTAYDPNAQAYWEYVPGYLLWLGAAYQVADLTGWPFHGVVQLAPIAADLAIAIAVYTYLGRKDATERHRVGAFAAVMLGPVFVAISGYHGQIDAVAILPAVLALLVWDSAGPRRALWAGLLAGVGGAIKSVPALVVLAFSSAARTTREGVTVVAAAVAVPLLVILPFYLAEPEGFDRVRRYAGVPGRGGLTLLTDPGFAIDRLTTPGIALLGHPSGVSYWLFRHGPTLTVILMLCVWAFLLRYRPRPLDGIMFVWLAIYTLSPGYLNQYLVWSLPFFLMAGYVTEVALLQIALIPALLVVYVQPLEAPEWAAVVYVVSLAMLWFVWVVCLARLGRRIIRSRGPRTPAHPQPANRARSSPRSARPPPAVRGRAAP